VLYLSFEGQDDCVAEPVGQHTIEPTSLLGVLCSRNAVCDSSVEDVLKDHTILIEESCRVTIATVKYLEDAGAFEDHAEVGRGVAEASVTRKHVEHVDQLLFVRGVSIDGNLDEASLPVSAKLVPLKVDSHAEAGMLAEAIAEALTGDGEVVWRVDERRSIRRVLEAGECGGVGLCCEGRSGGSKEVLDRLAYLCAVSSPGGCLTRRIEGEVEDVKLGQEPGLVAFELCQQCCVNTNELGGPDEAG
jgi:hypothetical protein